MVHGIRSFAPLLLSIIFATPLALAASMGASGKPCLLPGKSSTVAAPSNRGWPGAAMPAMQTVQGPAPGGQPWVPGGGYYPGPRYLPGAQDDQAPATAGPGQAFPYAPGMFGPRTAPGWPGATAGPHSSSGLPWRSQYGPNPGYREGGGMGMRRSVERPRSPTTGTTPQYGNGPTQGYREGGGGMGMGRPGGGSRSPNTGSGPQVGGGYPWPSAQPYAAPTPASPSITHSAAAVPRPASRGGTGPSGTAPAAPVGQTVTPYPGAVNDPWAADNAKNSSAR